MNEKIEKALERLGFAIRDSVHARRYVFGMPLENANRNWAKDTEALATLKAALEDYEKVKATLAEIEYYGESPTTYLAKVEAYTKLESEHETLKAEVERLRGEVTKTAQAALKIEEARDGWAIRAEKAEAELKERDTAYEEQHET